MKTMILSLCLVIGAHAFAGTDGPSNSGQAKPSDDCIESIRQVLNLNENSTIELTNGQCGFRIRYDKGNSGLTKKDYRTLVMVPSRLVDVQVDMEKIRAGIPKYIMADLNNATLEDNTNGLNAYSIKKCEVSSDHVTVSIARKQQYGWGRTDKYSIAMQLVNGKITAAQGSGDGIGKYNCQF